jgi:hypothetical protein
MLLHGLREVGDEDFEGISDEAGCPKISLGLISQKKISERGLHYFRPAWFEILLTPTNTLPVR